MDVPFLIRERLEQLGLEQRDLARAAKVTESYVSQLLTRRKAPPAPNRTDIYDKMDKFLKLPAGELARLAGLQRKEALKRELGESAPLFKEVRALVMRTCNPAKREEIRAIFEQQPFGELERLITQKLLDVVKRAAKQQLDNEYWLRMVARLSGQTFEEMRVLVLEFLDTDLFHVSGEHCASFLEPLIESWDIDLTSFALDVVLNPRVAPGHTRHFEFVDRMADQPANDEEGLAEFLGDPKLSGTATPEELAILRGLRFTGKRPTALYYYRELQSLRDPLHFRVA